MKILLTFNTNYAPHAAVVIESTIQNCPEKIGFIIIYHNLDTSVIEQLKTHYKDQTASMEFYKIEQEQIEQTLCKTKGSIGRFNNFELYLRLFAPLVLPEEETHIIYLDCDIIVNDNILKMAAEADISKPICAIPDYNPAYKLHPLNSLEPYEIPTFNLLVAESYWYRTYKMLNMKDDAAYFCSGILIFNLTYWREHKLAEKCFAFLREKAEEIVMPDQDILNHVINGNFFPLHPKWNSNFLGAGVTLGYTAEELKEALTKPSIIHCAGEGKPWLPYTASPYKKLYWKYRAATPFPKKDWGKINLLHLLKTHIKYKTINTTKTLFRIIFGEKTFVMLRTGRFYTDKKYKYGPFPAKRFE